MVESLKGVSKMRVYGKYHTIVIKVLLLFGKVKDSSAGGFSEISFIQISRCKTVLWTCLFVSV